MKNPKVFCPDCNHPWLWHGRQGCHTGHAGKDGGCKCPNPKNLHPRIRQPLVNLIIWAWPLMPRRLRVWAFMNEGPLKGDEKGCAIEPHLDRMPEGVKVYFFRDGVCLECQLPIADHRVFLAPNVADGWITCWTEEGKGAHGKYRKHFCVRAEDHPERA